MQVNVDKKQALKIAVRSFEICKRNEAKPIRDEFLSKYKNILKELGSAFGLLEYNAIDKSYIYSVGFELSDDNLIKENRFRTYELDESIYLEVGVDGENLEEAYDYVYKEYFPNKKYFHGLGPDIEFYQYDIKEDKIGNMKLFICLKENPHAVGVREVWYMKKLIFIVVIFLGLSSCSIHESDQTDQKLFYGDTLVKGRGLRDREKIDSGFIYNYEEDEECEDCQILY
mgnify:CR=1 FL=1